MLHLLKLGLLLADHLQKPILLRDLIRSRSDWRLFARRDLPLELPALVRALDVAPPSSALVDDAPSELDSPRYYAGSRLGSDAPPMGDSAPGYGAHQVLASSDR